MGARPQVSATSTFWHLRGGSVPPSEYDIVTSRLLYYVGRGFAVSTPLVDWYRQHQQGSLLRCPEGDLFRDPRETTYASYVALQHEQEALVDTILSDLEDSDHGGKLSKDWLRTLSRVLPPLRYPLHGLQMVACYVGHMAPSGRVVVASSFQAADEIRRIQRFAYRMRQLQEVDTLFGADAMACWQRDASYQPLRALIEQLLVTYDWGEALVALGLVLKPEFDELFMVRFARAARAAGDDGMARLLCALHEDCRWHHAWANALVSALVAAEPANQPVVSRWIETWRPRVRSALSALQPLVDVESWP